MGFEPAPEPWFLLLAQGFIPGMEQLFQTLPHPKSAAIGRPELQGQPPVRAFTQGKI